MKKGMKMIVELVKGEMWSQVQDDRASAGR